MNITNRRIHISYSALTAGIKCSISFFNIFASVHEHVCFWSDSHIYIYADAQELISCPRTLSQGISDPTTALALETSEKIDKDLINHSNHSDVMEDSSITIPLSDIGLLMTMMVTSVSSYVVSCLLVILFSNQTRGSSHDK